MISFLRRLTGGFSALFSRRAHARDLDDEVSAYREAASDAYESTGMSRREAERAARVDIGVGSAVKDYVRDVGWETWVHDLARDVRYATRRLRATPVLALSVVLTVGLGVGVNTAIFAVADAALFKSLPYKDPYELVELAYVIQRGTAEEARQVGVSWGQLDGWRTQKQIFSGIETFRPPQAAALEGAESSDATRIGWMSPGLVGLLGLSPVIGRGFGPADAVPDARVALLGESYWTRAFHGDRDVVGRTVNIDGRSFSIIGVLPAALAWGVDGRHVAAWLPLDERDDRVHGPSPFVDVIARIDPRLTLTEAKREVQLAGPRIARAGQVVAGNGRALDLSDVEPLPLDRRDSDTTRAGLLAFLGAATLILLIACANVANLLLTRNLSRHREIALRMAIGASRGRVVRQLLTEGAVLVALGGLAGWLFAVNIAALLPTLLPDELRLFEANPLAVDLRLAGFSLSATLLSGLLCCLVPALRSARRQALDISEAGPRTGGRSRRAHRMSQALQTLQVALTLVLLVGMTLLATSFVRMVQSRMGYDVSNLATATLLLESPGGSDPATEGSFFADVLSTIRRIPGAKAAYGNPPSNTFAGRLVFDGSARLTSVPGDPHLDVLYIDRDYLSITGISVRAGRGFTERDVEGSPYVALLDERAALRWPGGNPIGQRVRVSPYLPWATVVGVVNHIKTRGFAEAGGTMQAYFPLAQAPEMNRERRPLVLRAGADALGAIEAVKAATRNIRPALRIHEASAVRDGYGPALVTPRFAMTMMTLFAIVALLTASIGLYGTLNDVVRVRTTEIGIRMALGASAFQVCRVVVREALVPVASGLVMGLIAALCLSPVLTRLLFETTPIDPGALSLSMFMLVVVAAFAAFVPVRRATRIDPAVTLKTE